MFPPSQGLNLDVEAISGILGSISIACWVTVFTPQILENFQRGSTESLSVEFIIIWSLGDLFNVIGGVLQGVLPTMIILAVYYLLADIVLLGQCFYYRGFTWREDVVAPQQPTERSALLELNAAPEEERHHSTWPEVDVTHLSPATPLMVTPDMPVATRRSQTLLQTALFNAFAILMVVTAGIFGWWVSNRSQGGQQRHDNKPVHDGEDGLQLNFWGQAFGYGCALLYLGSRLPQMLHNYRRKSTEGLSGLFFLFACLGNVTYFLSIFAYEANCHGPEGRCEDGEAAALYGRYMLVNASWLLGSIGCLFLDLAILLQFFLYRPRDEEDVEEEEADENGTGDGDGTVDRRPLLSRMDSQW